MAEGRTLVQTLRREPVAVVLDEELEMSVGCASRTRTLLACAWVDDVREQLASRGEHELVLRGPSRRPEVELELEPRTARSSPRDRTNRRLEPRLVEDVRVQLEDRLA